jgi:hypothetical protein
VNEPFVTALIAGMLVPATPGETGAIKMIDVDFTLVLVIVVLEPVRALYPMNPEVRPEEVTLCPTPNQLTPTPCAEAISTEEELIY